MATWPHQQGSASRSESAASPAPPVYLSRRSMLSIFKPKQESGNPNDLLLSIADQAGGGRRAGSIGADNIVMRWRVCAHAEGGYVPSPGRRSDRIENDGGPRPDLGGRTDDADIRVSMGTVIPSREARSPEHVARSGCWSLARGAPTTPRTSQSGEGQGSPSGLTTEWIALGQCTIKDVGGRARCFCGDVGLVCLL